jgi:hypothetical protein
MRSRSSRRSTTTAPPATYYRALKDIAAWMPKNSILSAEGAGSMDIGLTMLPVFSAKACLNARTYGTTELAY